MNSTLSLSTLIKHIGVGVASASFWRGGWYILDDILYPGDPFSSCVASFGIGTVGMVISQELLTKFDANPKNLSIRNSMLTAASRLSQNSLRFGTLYVLATSCILIWRGTWIMWDLIYEQIHYCPVHKIGPRATDRDHATYSGLASHVPALIGLASVGLFASVLAPPAAVTIGTSAVVKAVQRSKVPINDNIISHKFHHLHHHGFLRTSMPRAAFLHTSSRFQPKRIGTLGLKHISPLNDRVLAVPL